MTAASRAAASGRVRSAGAGGRPAHAGLPHGAGRSGGRVEPLRSEPQRPRHGRSLGPGILRTESAAVAAGVSAGPALRVGPGPAPRVSAIVDVTMVRLLRGVRARTVLHSPLRLLRFATWTDRTTSSDGLRRGMPAWRSSGPSPAGCRPPPRCFSAVAPRRCCRRSPWAGSWLRSPVSQDAEVTVECNPETVDVAKPRGYREAGVTRLSFGVQSMVPDVLAALGRSHDVPSVPRAVSGRRRAGFAESYSVDLIFGAAGESAGGLDGEAVAAVLALDPPRPTSAPTG